MVTNEPPAQAPRFALGLRGPRDPARTPPVMPRPPAAAVTTVAAAPTRGVDRAHLPQPPRPTTATPPPRPPSRARLGAPQPRRPAHRRRPAPGPPAAAPPAPDVRGPCCSRPEAGPDAPRRPTSVTVVRVPPSAAPSLGPRDALHGVADAVPLWTWAEAWAGPRLGWGPRTGLGPRADSRPRLYPRKDRGR